MREFVKVTAVLVFGVSAVVAAIVWSDDRPSQSTWIWRIVLPVAALGAIVVFLVIHMRRDLVPDFLGQHCKQFFDCGGFCFAVLANVGDGMCMVRLMFQNRYERPCTGRIALRPAAGVFRSAVKLFRSGEIPPILFDISCGPAAFGMASIPMAVKKKHEGKNLTLQVGASVEYPQGKGRLLRFRDGVTIRHDPELESAFHAALQSLHLLGGGLMLSFPATATLRLPTGVAESIPPEQAAQRTEILWTLGDGVGSNPEKGNA